MKLDIKDFILITVFIIFIVLGVYKTRSYIRVLNRPANESTSNVAPTSNVTPETQNFATIAPPISTLPPPGVSNVSQFVETSNTVSTSTSYYQGYGSVEYCASYCSNQPRCQAFMRSGSDTPNGQDQTCIYYDYTSPLITAPSENKSLYAKK